MSFKLGGVGRSFNKDLTKEVSQEKKSYHKEYQDVEVTGDDFLAKAMKFELGELESKADIVNARLNQAQAMKQDILADLGVPEDIAKEGTGAVKEYMKTSDLDVDFGSIFGLKLGASKSDLNPTTGSFRGFAENAGASEGEYAGVEKINQSQTQQQLAIEEQIQEQTQVEEQAQVQAEEQVQEQTQVEEQAQVQAEEQVQEQTQVEEQAQVQAEEQVQAQEQEAENNLVRTQSQIEELKSLGFNDYLARQDDETIKYYAQRFGVVSLPDFIE